ncbi:helix-turn-helix domain-containing protein [Pedobacter cryoconitis]|uniref:helix-turn-helix domain-containing protein n=1 Tax=Pedobacter cryoconitis TaxID=188932 RepID=UPI001611DE5B|nr:helix-turn-helix domain-containing protein [Pedobacter cryoconitis]MBB5645620.1 AraC-like DNA-binding protein [Pedobacter cryoconitis]
MLLPTVGIEKIFNLPYTQEDFKIVYHTPIGMPVIPQAHKHDFYMALLIEKGTGTHTIDFFEHEVKPKTVFFLAPGQAHQWNLSKDTSGFQVMFSPDFLLQVQQKFPFFTPSGKSSLVLTDNDYHQLVIELKSLLLEASDQQAFYLDLLQHKLQIVLLLLKRAYQASFKTELPHADHRILSRFHQLLEKHYHTNSDVAYYANILNVTPNYLNQVCRKRSGSTAGDQIRERILLEAKRMLTLTSLDVKEIAFTLGFNDTSYFSRFFRKYTKSSPVEFRKINN